MASLRPSGGGSPAGFPAVPECTRIGSGSDWGIERGSSEGKVGCGGIPSKLSGVMKCNSGYYSRELIKDLSRGMEHLRNRMGGDDFKS